MTYEIKVYLERDPNNYRLLVTDNILHVAKHLEEAPGLLIAQHLNNLRKAGL